MIKDITKFLHKIPNDLQKTIASKNNILKKWKNITPLARNEWICWITSTKKLETRNHRIKRMCIELKEGINRPCCWPGCIHRKKKL